ncbi:MAG: dynamin-like GTPase family protein [Cyanobacteriota bacterium]|nr:dynamin-like GTPase family protein [Cyanobacteriota bacterium]
MSRQIPPQCQDLSAQVESLLTLLQQESTLRSQQDTTAIQASLRKAISPTFEIVFAGAFSAGKSMLINALLGRELLYSAEGHATGTECYISYAEPDNEQVVLTFLSQAEIREQAEVLCQRLKLDPPKDLSQIAFLDSLQQKANQIIEQEGGKSKSDKAKQADALFLLLDGFKNNTDRIDLNRNNSFSMQQFNFTNLKEAASYARRGSNSSVLREIKYFCHHPLLEDGNIIVDTPGIDAPVRKDALRTYEKIEHPDTSAVICVLKSASTGELTTEETELIERIQNNLSIRDRVFYVFNRIDETWYNSQLRQRLDNLISTQFRSSTRVYKTSGLLGFYGSQIRSASGQDRYGLDTIFSSIIKGVDGQEETPQFINEFNRYCGSSGKLVGTSLRPSVNGYETPLENYVRILGEWGTDLIDHMLKDSGIESFRLGITRYLTDEKRPQLFAALANDLQPLCISIRKSYLELFRELDSQPQQVEEMITHELRKLSQDLARIGEDFAAHISEEVNQVINGKATEFESDFRRLQMRMVHRLDELLNTFSVDSAYSRAISNHPRNSTAPLIAVLVEAFYYLSNELEDILVESCQTLINNYFQYLLDKVRKSDYYRDLYRLLGNDGGLEKKLKEAEERVSDILVSGSRNECDRYVRESPRFYDEGTFSIYQFRQVLQQTSQTYDVNGIREAEPAIRQLLKLDFEPKINQTVRSNFRQQTNNTLKNQLLPLSKQQAEDLLEKYAQARVYLEQTLAKEAEEKIQKNQRLRTELEENISLYNQAVLGINQCLQSMQLDRQQLPIIAMTDYVSATLEISSEIKGEGQ